MNQGSQVYIFSEQGTMAQCDMQTEKKPSYITQPPLLCGTSNTKTTQACTRLQQLITIDSKKLTQ